MNTVNGLAGKTSSDTANTGVTVTATEFTLRAPKYLAVQICKVDANQHYLEENTPMFSGPVFSSFPDWLKFQMEESNVSDPRIGLDGTYYFIVKMPKVPHTVIAYATDWIVMSPDGTLEVLHDEQFRKKYVTYPEDMKGVIS